MTAKNTRFRRVVARVRQGWTAGSAPAGDYESEQGPGNRDRFVMKPGEVRIIRGGGANISREPGESRGTD